MLSNPRCIPILLIILHVICRRCINGIDLWENIYFGNISIQDLKLDDDLNYSIAKKCDEFIVSHEYNTVFLRFFACLIRCDLLAPQINPEFNQNIYIRAAVTELQG